jgi:hypothetical protein
MMRDLIPQVYPTNNPKANQTQCQKSGTRKNPDRKRAKTLGGYSGERAPLSNALATIYNLKHLPLMAYLEPSTTPTSQN